MIPKLQFTLQKTNNLARAGQITLNGVTLNTPCFMPVGTKATMKGVPLERMSKEYLGTDTDIQLILNNSYHLYLRPGAEIIKEAGGTHKFQNWNKLILTDSGGFQVFSLGLSKTGKSLVKLHDHGVSFQSIHDGSKHLFTPENVVDLQRDIGSDIMMMLDVCSPVKDITRKKVEQHLALTHQRAKQAYEHHLKNYDDYKGVLFPIIQGGLYPDLRQQSAEILKEYALDWIAIGWLSVGESREEMFHILDELNPHLPTDKPRYVMGIGTPEDLIGAVERWVDMFDCVMPTRLGRHGHAFTSEWTLRIKNQRFAQDFWPLDPECRCHCCRNFSRAYLHHLFREGEMLVGSLLSLHNVAYLHKLCERMRQNILDS